MLRMSTTFYVEKVKFEKLSNFDSKSHVLKFLRKKFEFEKSWSKILRLRYATFYVEKKLY